MKFVCDKCGAQYKIRDEKIGRNGVSVRCKKCDNKIIVHLPSAQAEAAQFPSLPEESAAPAASREMREEAASIHAIARVEAQAKAQEAGALAKAPASSSGSSKRADKGKKESKEGGKEGIDDERSAAAAISKAAVAAFSQNVEREGSSISTLPFDLGLEDEAVGQAIESVMADKPSNPFNAVPSLDVGAAASDGFTGFESDTGDSTRVVNLLEMASLMKVKKPEPAASVVVTPKKASEPPAKKAIAPGEEWFVAIDGQQQGPMDFEAIKALWDKGDVSTESLVWNAQMVGWEPLGSVPTLAKKLEPPKPPLSDPPRSGEAPSASPAFPASSGLSGEWAAEGGPGTSGLPAAASLPSPQPAPQESSWKPSAASMLSSLIQDEISALDKPSVASLPPTGVLSAPPQASAAPAPSLLPALAPLPSPSAGFMPDVPPSHDMLQPPLPPDPYAPDDGFLGAAMPAGGAFPEDTNGHGHTAPGGYAEEDAAAHWEQPIAVNARGVRDSRAKASDRRPRGAPSAGARRPGRGDMPHHQPSQQPLPQMPSQSSGMLKWGLGLGLLVVLALLAVVLLKFMPSTELPQPPIAAVTPPAPPPVAAPTPAQPPVPVPVPAAPAAAQPEASEPAVAAVPPVPAAPPPATVAVAPTPTPTPPPAAQTVEPTPPPKPAVVAKPEPSRPERSPESRRIAQAEPKPAPPAARPTPPPSTRKPARAGTRLDDFDSVDSAGAEVAAPTPKARPAPAAPASKIDDDFERLFGGGGSGGDPEPAKPAQRKPTVYVPPPTGGGAAAKASLSQNDIMGEVMRNRSAIKSCTDEADDSGTIVMRWTIEQSGKPSGIKTNTAQFRGSELEGCLKRVIQGMKFPAYSGPQMQPIDFPFKF